MPNITIEVRRAYSREEEEKIISAVHMALMEALKTPNWDRTIRLIAHEPHRFAIPPGCDNRYILIEADLFPGRSIEAKRALYQATVRNLKEMGIPPDHIKILLRESRAENWGIRGGVAACDVDIDFKTDV